MSKAEQLVVAYMRGDLKPPSYLKPFVSEYQKYDTMIREVVSYPRSVDQKMDTIYDTLVAVVSLKGEVR